MFLRSGLFAFLALVVAGIAGQASAAETTGTFKATTEVASSCAVAVNRGVSFNRGPYNPVTTHATTPMDTGPGFSVIVITCNRQATPVYAYVDEGLTPSAGSTCASPLRNMVSESGGRLPYRLFNAVGPGVGTEERGCSDTNRKEFSFASVQKNTLNIAGRVAPGLSAAPGDYSDTVTVTVTF